MPSIRVTLAALCLMAFVAGIGGYFLLRPPAPEPRPPHGKFDPKAPPPEGPTSGASAAPKLVVFVVFDQMRGDYLSRWAECYSPDGFERVKREGVWFSECHVPYACTSTGPGHAALSTGAPPSANGIVENVWYDRSAGAHVYCCQPRRVYDLVPPVPAEFGKPSRGSALGYSPERLLAQTVSDSLHEATKGQGRTFSLSMKDRTAVLMGGQKPTGVYCFDTRDGRFHTGAFYGRDAAHAWVTEFNNTKPADAWFDKPWEKSRPDLDYAKYSGPGGAPGEARWFNWQTGKFPHDLKGKLAAPAMPYYTALEASPFGNDLLLDFAKRAVAAEKLGRGDAPDLLCVSFSSTDLVGHQYGPDSQEVLDATLRADRLVGQFLAFLDQEVGAGKYVMVIAADHGVCPLPELPSTKEKYPAAKRTTVEELATGLDAALTAMYGRSDAPPWVEALDDDTWPWVYLNHKSVEARKLKLDDVAAAARDYIAGRGHIETAFTRADLAGEPGADQPLKRAAKLAFHPDRCGDVIAVPKPGVLVTKYKAGASHGSPHAYDAHIPFLMYGAGVPALGRRAEKVSSLSVAPALAWALGVPAPKHAALDRPAALPARK